MATETAAEEGGHQEQAADRAPCERCARAV